MEQQKGVDDGIQSMFKNVILIKESSLQISGFHAVNYSYLLLTIYGGNFSK